MLSGGIPAIQADQWYGTGNDTLWPRPGHPTLLVWFSHDFPQFATLRRLRARYGARGLDIVFTTSTQGYFRNLPMPVPTVEADSLGSYVTRFLKLPGGLAVEITRFNHTADGRRRNELTQNLKFFDKMGGVVFVDAKGIVRWIGEVTPRTEATWDAVIQTALAQ